MPVQNGWTAKGQDSRRRDARAALYKQHPATRCAVLRSTLYLAPGDARLPLSTRGCCRACTSPRTCPAPAQPTRHRPVSASIAVGTAPRMGFAQPLTMSRQEDGARPQSRAAKRQVLRGYATLPYPTLGSVAGRGVAHLCASAAQRRNALPALGRRVRTCGARPDPVSYHGLSPQGRLRSILSSPADTQRQEGMRYGQRFSSPV